MVSARHGLSKCTAAVTSKFRISSQEPLLFLYPPWARHIASSTAPVVDHDVPTTHYRAYPDQAPSLESDNTRNSERHQADDIDTPHRPLNGADLLKLRRITANVNKLAENEFVEQNRRNEWYEMIREENELEPISPIKVFENLLGNTPKRIPGSVVRVQVPEGAVPGLLFGVENNILEIKHQTGAEIDLLEEEPGEKSGIRTFSISGPSVSVGSAATIIAEAIPGATSKALPDTPVPRKFSTKEPEVGSSSQPRARFVLSTPHSASERRPMRADAVPRPDIYTAESLHTYVTSLTLMPMPGHMHRLLYEPGEEHRMVVAELLDDVFDSDECLQVLSLTTLNEGISYFMKHNQIHFVKEIYHKVQLRGMKLNTETFNIMLRGAAKVKDIDTFGQLVDSMLHRDIRPDSGTWLAFLTVWDDDPTATMKIVLAMKQLGLFYEAGVQAKVCEMVAPQQLQARLDGADPTPVIEFLRDMQNYFSDQWLTTSGANKLLKVWGARGMISECWLLSEYMTQRGIKLDVVGGNTVLDACCKLSGLKIGIDLFERMLKDHQFTPDEVTWAIASKHVWEAHYYATARVIWRYGCLKGWTSYPMRTRVATSLSQRFSDPHVSWVPSASRSRSWAQNAGAFVVTDRAAVKAAADALRPPAPAQPDHPELEDVEPETSERAVSWRPLPLRTVSEQAARRFAFTLVKDDTDLATLYEPVGDPIALIKEALAVDLRAEASEMPFLERMEWLDAHSPWIRRKKRAHGSLRERVLAQERQVRIPGTVVGGFSSDALRGRKQKVQQTPRPAPSTGLPTLSLAERSAAKAARKQREREERAEKEERGEVDRPHFLLPWERGVDRWRRERAQLSALKAKRRAQSGSQ